MNIRAVFGVAGVSASENLQAKKVGRIFENLVLAALIVVFAQLILSYTAVSFKFTWINHLVWVVFALEFVVNLSLVDRRFHYVKQNWLNLLIVVLAFPWIEWSSEWALIIRTLRLLLLMRFFANFLQDVSSLLGKNRFGQVLIGFALLIVGAGGVFVYIEDRPFIDGIWYALVTITTVGYGDVVPQTENGRVFGSILIIFGVLFFSLVTANFSAFLVGSEQRKLEKEILGYVQNTEKRLTKLSTENERHVEYIMLHMSKELEQLKAELTELRQKELQHLRNEIDSRRPMAAEFGPETPEVKQTVQREHNPKMGHSATADTTQNGGSTMSTAEDLAANPKSGARLSTVDEKEPMSPAKAEQEGAVQGNTQPEAQRPSKSFSVFYKAPKKPD